PRRRDSQRDSILTLRFSAFLCASALKILGKHHSKSKLNKLYEHKHEKLHSRYIIAPRRSLAHSLGLSRRSPAPSGTKAGPARADHRAQLDPGWPRDGADLHDPA